MMEKHDVTTPFGRRPISLGMLASQFQAQKIEPEKAVDKWKLFRAVCAARATLGVSDRALAVLNALLSFYPKSELSEENGLVVFPSNAQLSIRAHGIAPATLRRHLAALVDAGLIIRRDSPNGKRYARKDSAGEIEQAFGFSFAALLARADEIEQLAAAVEAERHRLKLAREQLTLCRRDIAKLIETALEEGLAGDWLAINEHFRRLVIGVQRSTDTPVLHATLEEMEMLREEILNRLEIQLKTSNTSANESQIERHIQNSNPDPLSDLEPRSRKEQGEKSVGDPKRRAEPIRAFPLGMVLQACPDISLYGPGGTISNWRDLMSAAVVVRSMLGISPSAYQEACEILGPENAASVVACILERGGHINSAGGYLRDLTRRAERQEFSIGPMIMALIRSHGSAEKKTG